MTCPFATYPNRLGLNLKYIVSCSPDNFIDILMKEKSIKSPSVDVSLNKIPANHSSTVDTAETNIKICLKHFHGLC